MAADEHDGARDQGCALPARLAYGSRGLAKSEQIAMGTQYDRRRHPPGRARAETTATILIEEGNDNLDRGAGNDRIEAGIGNDLGDEEVDAVVDGLLGALP